MDSVARILKDLELDNLPQITVFNKSDLLPERQRVELAGRPASLVVSALTGAGTDALVNHIGRLLKKSSTPLRPETAPL